jgi:hypothetical protein
MLLRRSEYVGSLEDGRLITEGRMVDEYDHLIAEELEQEPRSAAYKDGMRQALLLIYTNRPVKRPTPGTSDYDAFEAGAERVTRLYGHIRTYY